MSLSVYSDKDFELYVTPAYFHFESKAIQELLKCDFNCKITLEMAIKSKASRKIRVYTDGIYDLFHSGHARQFMQAKNIFENIYLIVGACNDQLASSLKGRTVLNEKERYESIKHCRYVDEIITDAPLIITDEFLNKHKIDFVAQDPEPYPITGSSDVYKFVKERGIFLPTSRTEGVSTTEIISRILKDYDVFIERNIRKGCSSNDLNINGHHLKKNGYLNCKSSDCIHTNTTGFVSK